jgi:mannose-1-phosphate guanylyltransferase
VKKVTTAVILVGGAGLRMRPFTEDKPKCMVPINGKPLIHWTLSWLKNNGFKHIVLGVAYHKEAVIDYVKANPQGLKVDFSEHTVEGETGEGFRFAISRFVKDEDFLAMNGDEITTLDLNRLEEAHLAHKPLATVAVAPMRSPFGVLELEVDNIVCFKEKPLIENVFVSIGIYMFNQKILDYIPMDGSIEKTVFPLLVKKNALKACRLKPEEAWLTINSLKDLSVAEKEFAKISRDQA